jgi:hypothetical protein
MMKIIGWTSFPLAALSMAFLMAGVANAQSTMAASAPNDSRPGASEAARMVPARAYLTRRLDAKDAKPGTQFTADLSKTVTLKSGTELLRGTKLIGTVATDDMNMQGASKLALRITEAQTKDGKTIPVKATIVGVYGPESETAEGYTVTPGDEQANDWTRSTLAIDEVNAMSGVDLHSRIAGRNSGVFVSKKKDDVKLSAGSELALAIAQSGNGQPATGNSGGM